MGVAAAEDEPVKVRDSESTPATLNTADEVTEAWDDDEDEAYAEEVSTASAFCDPETGVELADEVEEVATAEDGVAVTVTPSTLKAASEAFAIVEDADAVNMEDEDGSADEDSKPAAVNAGAVTETTELG
jgi:hypothetical protein